MKVLNKTTQEKPDDTGKVMIEGHIKIFDPTSGEVFVEKRGQ